DQSQALELIAQLRSPEVPVRLNYGPVHAALRLNPRTSELYGQIGLNQPPPAAKGKGFVFAGQLDRLPLDSWLEFWSRWPLSSSGTGRLRQLELNAEHVHLQGKNLGAHRVQAQRVESGWKGALTAPYAAGDWTWESRTKRLSLRLDFIDLDKLSQLAQNPKLPRYSPATPWPALTLHAQRLRWRKHDLGALTFKTFPEAAQVPFELTLAGSWHRLEASGRWRQAEPTATQVSGRFSSQDLGKFLQHIGYSTALAQTPTTLDFKLDWPGAPQFSVAKLNGFAHLETGPGRWLDADPKAARLLGLLYLGTLERRLRLDFSDLFQAGLAYERIGGRIRIKDGLALTDDLSIAAISARIHIAGTVDLVNHQVDEYVTVSPNTPATLGLFREYSSNGLGKMANFTQRLINAPLDSVTQSQYAIYGTLDNPTIVLLRRSLPGAMLHGIWSKLQGLTGNPNE
ncbi:YhdP family protein, partial [Methylothermus subterraneus]